MKKVLASIAIVLLVAVVSVCFVGCTNDEIDYTKKDHYVVGICQLVTHDALDAATKGFKDALQAEVEKAGKTVEFDEQNASGDSGICTTISNSFVSKKVDLIMANATAALQAAANATTKIPVLGTSITEYSVALDLKNFNGTVGGNISGTSDLAPLTEQAQMIIDLVSGVKKVGLLYCSGEPNSDYQVKAVADYLATKGVASQRYSFTDTNDIAQVVNRIVSDKCDAVYIPTDNTAASNGPTIDNILLPNKIPVIAGEEGICKACGIATLSISYYNIGVKTGKMAAEILLKGKKVSEMPIQYDAEPVKKFYKSRANQFPSINIPPDYAEIVEADAE